jgi:hypothetical protein
MLGGSSPVAVEDSERLRENCPSTAGYRAASVCTSSARASSTRAAAACRSVLCANASAMSFSSSGSPYTRHQLPSRIGFCLLSFQAAGSSTGGRW